MNLYTGATLKNLINTLGPVRKADRTPTSRKLREEAGEPFITTDSIMIYPCGYAVYENESGRTVMWVPGCTSFTYYFNKTTDAEKDVLAETVALPEGMLESLPWEMALTLIGDHRIEANRMNSAMGNRKGTEALEEALYGDKTDDVDEAVEKSYRKEYNWREDQIGENPETIYIRKETREEARAAMTDKQWEVFELYYLEGYRQQEIAAMLNLSRTTIEGRLNGALRKFRKIAGSQYDLKI